jgi:hypothetical protein
MANNIIVKQFNNFAKYRLFDILNLLDEVYVNMILYNPNIIFTCKHAYNVFVKVITKINNLNMDSLIKNNSSCAEPFFHLLLRTYNHYIVSPTILSMTIDKNDILRNISNKMTRPLQFLINCTMEISKKQNIQQNTELNPMFQNYQNNPINFYNSYFAWQNDTTGNDNLLHNAVKKFINIIDTTYLPSLKLPVVFNIYWSQYTNKIPNENDDIYYNKQYIKYLIKTKRHANINWFYIITNFTINELKSLIILIEHAMNNDSNLPLNYCNVSELIVTLFLRCNVFYRNNEKNDILMEFLKNYNPDKFDKITFDKKIKENAFTFLKFSCMRKKTQSSQSLQSTKMTNIATGNLLKLLLEKPIMIKHVNTTQLHICIACEIKKIYNQQINYNDNICKKNHYINNGMALQMMPSYELLLMIFRNIPCTEDKLKCYDTCLHQCRKYLIYLLYYCYYLNYVKLNNSFKNDFIDNINYPPFMNELVPFDNKQNYLLINIFLKLKCGYNLLLKDSMDCIIDINGYKFSMIDAMHFCYEYDIYYLSDFDKGLQTRYTEESLCNILNSNAYNNIGSTYFSLLDDKYFNKNFITKHVHRYKHKNITNIINNSTYNIGDYFNIGKKCCVINILIFENIDTPKLLLEILYKLNAITNGFEIIIHMFQGDNITPLYQKLKNIIKYFYENNISVNNYIVPLNHCIPIIDHELNNYLKFNNEMIVNTLHDRLEYNKMYIYNSLIEYYKIKIARNKTKNYLNNCILNGDVTNFKILIDLYIKGYVENNILLELKKLINSESQSLSREFIEVIQSNPFLNTKLYKCKKRKIN